MNKKSAEIVEQIRKDLYNLANFLGDKEPFDQRMIDDARSWLLEIEYIMTGAIEKIEDIEVARPINQALNLLPDVDSDPKEWPPQIYNAAKAI